MSVRRWLAAAAVWLALAACGDDTGRGIAGEVAGPLAERVAAVRAAAAEDRERALAELDELREEVAGYVDRGDLSDVAAERILAAADAVQTALTEQPAVVPTTTPPPAVTTTAPAAGDERPAGEAPAGQEQQGQGRTEAPEDQPAEEAPEEPEDEQGERQREEQEKSEEEREKSAEEREKSAEEQEKGGRQEDDGDG